METFKKWLNRPLVVISLLAIFGAVDLILLGRHLELGKSDWASWVQALGSIGALAVAIFVMSRQNAHARDMFLHADRIALLRRAIAVEVLVKNADTTIRGSFTFMLGSTQAGTYPNLTLSNLDIWMESIVDARKTLESVPLYELGSPKLISAALEMFDDLSHVSNCYKDWLSAGVAPAPETFKALSDYYPANELGCCSAFKAGVAEMRAG